MLRPSVGGEKELSADGDSVGQILRSVADEYPDTQSQLFSADGELNRYVNVYLNDEDVRVLDGLDTSVGESDTLVILPAMAGGAAEAPSATACTNLIPPGKAWLPPRRPEGRVFNIEGSRMPRVLMAAPARSGPASRPRRSSSPASALVALAGIAVAKSFTLKVAKNVHVTNTPTKSFRVKAVDVHEAVAVGPSGYAVYTFQGETTHHLICKKTTSASTNCWAFWPPVSVKSAKGSARRPGIKGKLGTFKNHGTLRSRSAASRCTTSRPTSWASNKKQATGDELKTFGSIWHIVTASGKSKSTNSPPPMQSQGGLPPGY